MSLELIIVICIVSTVAGTISAGIRYYRNVLRRKNNEKVRHSNAEEKRR